MRGSSHIRELSKANNWGKFKPNQSFIDKKNRFTAHKHEFSHSTRRRSATLSKYVILDVLIFCYTELKHALAHTAIPRGVRMAIDLQK
jgi:hypothetical protein